MGQSKVRKQLMGDRYGKDSNPWNGRTKPTIKTKTDDFATSWERIRIEITLESMEKIILSDENTANLDLSRLKQSFFQKVLANKEPVFAPDVARSLWQFDCGKQVQTSTLKKLKEAKTVPDYLSLVKNVDIELSFAFFAFENGEAEMSVDAEDFDEYNIPRNWDRSVSLAFCYYSDFAAGIYHAHNADDLTLLRSCKLLAISSTLTNIESDEDDGGERKYDRKLINAVKTAAIPT